MRCASMVMILGLDQSRQGVPRPDLQAGDTHSHCHRRSSPRIVFLRGICNTLHRKHLVEFASSASVCRCRVWFPHM